MHCTGMQVSAPQPAYMRRFFRAFMLDIGRSQFEAATWTAVALVAIWASFIGAGLQALDRRSGCAGDYTGSRERTAARRTPLLTVIAQNIHQVRDLHAAYMGWLAWGAVRWRPQRPPQVDTSGSALLAQNFERE